MHVQRDFAAAPADSVTPEHRVPVNADGTICVLLLEVRLSYHCDGRTDGLQVCCQVDESVRLR